MRSIGSSLFKPQTVLFAPEPRRGTDETRPQASSSTLLVRASKRGDPKGGQCEASHASLVYGRYSEAMMRAWRLAES
jgi:hypothetical protein